MADIFDVLCRPDDLSYNGVAGELYTRLCDDDEEIPLELLFTNEWVRDDEYTAMRIVIDYIEAISMGVKFPLDARRAARRAWNVIETFMDDGGYECYEIPESVGEILDKFFWWAPTFEWPEDAHPLVAVYTKGIKHYTTFLSENPGVVGETYGRSVLEYLLWANLNDTPYSQGIQTLAGWTSKDDANQARGMLKKEW